MTNDVPSLRTCSAVVGGLLLLLLPGGAAPAITASLDSKPLASYRWQPFEPVVRPSVPRVNSKWAANPIDAFIASEHRARGLKPRPETSKEVLLRRVYLDLIGLSPTPEDLRAFESDRSPRAYEKVVDRLLAD